MFLIFLDDISSIIASIQELTNPRNSLIIAPPILDFSDFGSGDEFKRYENNTLTRKKRPNRTMSHSIGEPISLNQVIDPNNSLTSTNNSCSSIIIKLSVEGNLKFQIKLTGEVVSELNWWIHNLQLSKGDAITALPFSSVVTSDGELVLSQQRYPIDLLRKEGAYKCF